MFLKGISLVLLLGLGFGASAAKLDEFARLCSVANGGYKEGAQGYLQSDGKTPRGVAARCAIESGSDNYIDASMRSSGPFATFNFDKLNEFKAACPGELSVAAIPGLEGSVGILATSNIRAHAYVVLVCDLNQ